MFLLLGKDKSKRGFVQCLVMNAHLRRSGMARIHQFTSRSAKHVLNI